jgi:RHS repeat-associated protein
METNQTCLYEPLSAAATPKNQISGFCYDSAGNLLRQNTCGAIDYAYDAENRMTSFLGSNYVYTYDGDGERVKRFPWAMYWFRAGGEPLAESDTGANLTKEFIFFAGKRIARLDLPSGAVHYYFSDHLGSSDVVTNATGATIEDESEFYPFGGERLIIDTLPDQQYKFTGKERDPESGLDYFGARYYSSSLGRFITPDWAAKPTAVPYAELADPQSLNLYGYVRNNPMNGADKDGHCPECIGFILGAAVGAGEILYQTGDAYFTGKGHIPTNQETADKLLERGIEGGALGAAYHAGQEPPGEDKGNQPDNEPDQGQHPDSPDDTSSPSAPDASPDNTGSNPPGSGTVPPSDRDPKRFFDKQTKQDKASEAGQKCTICGQPTVPAEKHQKGVTPPANEGHTHHIVPWSEGGRTVPDNAAHVCRTCNLGGKKKE